MGEGCCAATIDLARACVRMPAGPSGWCSMPGAQAAVTGPPWPNGQGVGPLIRRLWAQVPQGVGTVALVAPARESPPDDAYITLARIAASFA